MIEIAPFAKTLSSPPFRARLVTSLAFTLGIILLIVAAGGAQAVSTVAIQAPADGSSAGTEVTIKGNARLKAGEFLWLVARRSDFEPVWWPQRGLTPNAAGDFAATATLGTARDIGYQFDVAVITVDAAGNQQLTDYRTNALTNNDYKPIRLPATTSPPRIVRVRKTSDR